MRKVVLVAVTALTVLLSHAEDWRSFRHDFMRSGKSPEQIKASTLKSAWIYDNGFVPEPAWFGPAKRDSYARVEGLRSMRDYDTALHTISVGDKVYFGSTVDHSVYCLNAKNGEIVWRFTTNGPIRVVPTWFDNKVYFGSDDGFVYCLYAESGKLLWKNTPVKDSSNLIAYNNIISTFPCRTGVTVSDGKLFCGFSMLPWEKTYLCSLDPQTGKKLYSMTFDALTMEAPFAYSAGRLIAPQGRISPVIFDASNGKKLGSLKKGGGSFVLVTDDHRIIHGPGNKKGWMNDSDEKDPAKVVSINNANAMLVHAGKAFVLSDKSLECFDRANRAKVWSKKIEFPFSLILGGNTLYVGGMDKVGAFDAATGAQLWEERVDGRAKGLTVANGQLLVSTDTGKIYSFRESTDFVWQQGGDDPEKAVEHKGNHVLTAGPFVSFSDKNSAVIKWIESERNPSELLFYTGSAVKPYKAANGVKKQVKITGLKHNFIHHYQIATKVDGKTVYSKKYELDTFFNFRINEKSLKLKKDGLAKYVDSLKLSSKGIAVVAGLKNGKSVYSLLNSGFKKVVCLEKDSAKVEKLRQKLFDEKLYGRIVVRQTLDLANIPVEFANLVVSESEYANGKFEHKFEDLYRLLKTGEGTLLALNSKTDMKRFVPPVFMSKLKGRILTAEKVADAAEWRHQYGNPDNAGFAGEGLGGSSNVDQMQIQWLSRPGPRFQADRNGRKTSPLVAGGKLFVQGLERIVAIDRANGSVLWSKEMPGFMRFNIPRDCSNWCTDGEFIYAADKKQCLKIDCDSGEVVEILSLTKPNGKEAWEWSYIANYKSLLIGSTAIKGTHHTNFYGGGGQGWYDAGSGPVTYKLCSDNIFAKSKSGKPVWKYEKGLIVNSTITLSNNRVFFIESHSKALKTGKNRRLDDSEEFRNSLFLVSLDMKTGKPVWKRKIKPDEFKVMLHLASSDGVLVMMSSATGKYFVQGFSGKSGKLIWKNSGPWKQSHHGGHMSRPVIVGNKVYVRPNVFDLKSGHLLEEVTQPFGSCGTYAATAHSMIYRHGTVTMWGIEDNKISKWTRLRPGCWLSTLPAEGMILSPEAGGGCSCGNWLETSVGFAPKKRADLMFASADKHFVDSFAVELVKLNPNAVVRYSVDGSDVTASSKQFKSGLVVKGDTLFKAALFVNSKKTVQLERQFLRIYPAPVFADTNMTFVEGKTVDVKIGSVIGKEAPVTRFTLDGSVPTESSALYNDKITLDKTAKVSFCNFYKDGGKSKVVSHEFKQMKMLEAENVSNLKNGVNYKVVDKNFSKMPDFTKQKFVKEGAISYFDLSVAGKENGFAVLYDCYLNVEADGLYGFQTSSDDGSMLWIADELIVNNDGLHGAQKRSGKVALKKGYHKLKVGFFDAGGGKSLNVWMSDKSGKFVKMKPSQLWIKK